MMKNALNRNLGADVVATDHSKQFMRTLEKSLRVAVATGQILFSVAGTAFSVRAIPVQAQEGSVEGVTSAQNSTTSVSSPLVADSVNAVDGTVTCNNGADHVDGQQLHGGRGVAGAANGHANKHTDEYADEHADEHADEYADEYKHTNKHADEHKYADEYTYKHTDQHPNKHTAATV